MRRGCILSVIGASAVVCVVLPGWGAGFDRSQYELIVTMNPFGERPRPAEGLGPGGVPLVKAPELPQVPFSATFRLTMIRRDDALGAVCTIEDTKNPLWHAYLRAGESQDGIVVKKIDLEATGVLLGKDGRDDEWLFLNGAGGIAVASGARNQTVGAAPSPRSKPPWRVGHMARQSESTEPKVEQPPQMTGPELEEHLKKYQMDLIRAGGDDGPPLPMELTPEMDAQLVNEGVLPPLQ